MLKGGHFVEVLSILLRLQRICNHPGLVEPRLPQSSFSARPLQLRMASLVLKALDRDAWQVRRDLGRWACPGVLARQHRAASVLCRPLTLGQAPPQGMCCWALRRGVVWT